MLQGSGKKVADMSKAERRADHLHRIEKKIGVLDRRASKRENKSGSDEMVSIIRGQILILGEQAEKLKNWPSAYYHSGALAQGQEVRAQM